ncbi:hypothetical protein TWF718_009999 [Orbilia javanica]|uniref:Uncharacterized protein n=1 Tax=Orbilia javanica TaxID=47235 RepID=A0AAN8MTB9_9PEZI
MKTISVFSLFLGALVANTTIAIQHVSHHETVAPSKLDLIPRAANRTSSAKTWKWSDMDKLGKIQLFWINKSPNPGFDPVLARKMGSRLRADPDKLCGVKPDGRCLIADCNPEKDIGLYLCNYRPQGFETACHVFGLIAEDTMDRWEGKDTAGMYTADFEDSSVQAYSYWSEDPTWVVVYTMPCLRAVQMDAAEKNG